MEGEKQKEEIFYSFGGDVIPMNESLLNARKTTTGDNILINMMIHIARGLHARASANFAGGNTSDCGARGDIF